MTKEELDYIGGMNMCDEISNEAYKKIVCHFEGQEQKIDILDKIMTEIEEHAYPVRYGYNSIEKGMTLTGINQVIDKYRQEGV